VVTYWNSVSWWKKVWFERTIGVGNLGATGWKQVMPEAGEDIFTGIAIGMITNTSHMVIVVPGGPLLLV
jgi:hypothetical protein